MPVDNARTPKIVVITPIKNEAWIIDRFLAVTSQFADSIIIADQNSIDDSQNICKKYPKVTIIENKSAQFNEAERQILLIQKARELIREPKLIMALDADEIIDAKATKTLGWQSMLKAKPGTIICFERIDLYLTPDKCLRYDEEPCYIGYMDDGVEHKPKPIHSIRIPTPDYAPKLFIHDVKILHYALTRPTGDAAKRRLYCVIENLLAKANPFGRRWRYASNKNYTEEGRLELSDPEWFTGWEDIGIDMRTILHQKYYYYDFEVLKYFHKYGWHRFWLEDIWKFDWEACRLYAKSLGIIDIPNHEIPAPPKIIGLIVSGLTVLYNYIRKLVKRS